MDLFSLTETEWTQIGVSVLIFIVIAILGRRLIKFIFKRIIHRFRHPLRIPLLTAFCVIAMETSDI